MANLKTTTEHLEILREVFLALDTNNDGKLSFEEIKAGV